MKIVVTGTRGIPRIMGGVETHCEELFPRIAAMGHDVAVIRRSCYVTDDNRVSEYRGVKLRDIYAPRKKSLEAIVHTFLAVLEARRMKADVLHIHAVGPSIMVPLARLLGLRVVMTHHGPDYDRQKWGFLARTMLKMGERCGARHSNAVIAISHVIADILMKKYNRQSHLIFNGVNKPAISGKDDYTTSLGLERGRYVVAVGRFVKEKCFDQLIEAYSRLGQCGFKLVIAGDADHEDGYSAFLKEKARKAGVLLTGFVQKDKVAALCKACTLFVLPSFHEGLPISLLEAMSTGADVLVSDIPANLEIGLGKGHYFKVGDVDDMAVNIDRHLDNPSRVTYDMSLYDWDVIACETKAVYDSLLS